VDAPCFGRPVRVIWRKRRWRCPDPGCARLTFVEQDEKIAAPRALLTVRACWWAIGQLRREHASVAGIARQLGTTWNTVWASIKPLLKAAAEDPTRFEGVDTLGVDEHVWHHVSTKPAEDGGRGLKELTGMVDLTRHPGKNGKVVVRARLLDLVPGRTGSAYKDWLNARGKASASGSRSPPWTPSTGARTPSTTSSPTPPPSWTPSTSSSLALKPSTRSAAASNRTPSVTAAVRTTRCTGSGTTCVPDERTSPTNRSPA